MLTLSVIGYGELSERPAFSSQCTMDSFADTAYLLALSWLLALPLSGFANHWEAFMGSKEDPEDGMAVATTCYVAALIYAAFVLFCGCQLGAHKRYSRIQL